MQEKFALRKTLKKVAAVGTSLAMVGVTISGALAAGLGDYSKDFSKSNSVVVFGAAGSDSAAVNDVLAGLPGSAGGTTTTVETVAGALSLEDFDEGEDADFEPGVLLNSTSAFGKNCFTDNDDIGLEEWDQNVNIDIDQDYKVHEEFCFGLNGRTPKLSCSLAELDEDYGTNCMILTQKTGLNYSLIFEKALPVSNRVVNATTTKQINIDSFLGKKLKISGGSTGSPATQFTALVGDEYNLKTGDKVVVDGHTVELIAIDANEVLVSVDGDAKTIDENKNYRFSGDVEIHVDSAIETKDGQGLAVLFVGNQASETFTNGDHAAGEDDKYYLWEWMLGNLNGGFPVIGINLAENLNSDNTNLKDEVMDLGLLRGNRRHMLPGDYICLPNYHECLVFEGEVKEMSRCEVKFAATGDTEDLPGTNSSSYTSSKILEVDSSGCGNNKGLKVDTGADGTVDTDTDRVLLFWDDALDGDQDGKIPGELLVYYENSDGNITRVNRSTSAYGWDADTAEINTTTDVGSALFEIKNDDYDNAAVVLLGFTNTTGGGFPNFVFTSRQAYGPTVALLGIELDDEGGRTNGIAPRLQFEAGLASGTGNGIVNLGAQKGADTTKWLRYASNASNYKLSSDSDANSSISGLDEDVMANSGVIVKDPEGNYDSDEIILEVPNDDEFKFKVRVAQPKEGKVKVTTTGGVAAGDVSMSDEEVDLATVGKNVVAVGGPAVNKATAELLGVAFPTYGADVTGLAEGLAVVERKTMASGKAALLVYGWEQDDTRRAAVLLKDPAVFAQKLSDAGKSDADSVTVSGTSLEVAGITVA